ncbi:hypothetical protein RJT34_25631 [Clitoria ternatea]|uniref:Polyphenol oxidase C-terminal domain-containing protein n=1 Tax=Clitoria ternatea TaxID=43366 RepID=A0AAN9IIP6_CLITE
MNEYLIVEGIEFDRNMLVKFDVLINADDCYELTEANHVEYMRTFFNLPHEPVLTLMLILINLLEDFKAQNDDIIVFTLVLKCGEGIADYWFDDAIRGCIVSVHFGAVLANVFDRFKSGEIVGYHGFTLEFFVFSTTQAWSLVYKYAVLKII